MTVALSLPHPYRWSTDDLDALPDDGTRRELVDGALVVSPAPSYPHQKIASRIERALEDTCPSAWAAAQCLQIKINRHRALVPNVVVVSAKAAANWPPSFAPHEVLLVVEVVSPGSTSMDRITKPRLYAQAGILHYWRVETQPTVTVHIHRLAPSGYRETGAHRDTVVLDEPWPLRLPLEALTAGLRATT